jgi:glucosyl-dolichyl phosphate glucuronosyltransferase
MVNRVDASAIICTHNRAESLPATLASLRRQDAIPEGFEVIVVDNASTDGTPAVVAAAQREWPGAPDALRLVHEPRLGLNHARNRGIAEARGEVVAFLDDDAVAVPGWLGELTRAYRPDPDVWCVGGKVSPRWPDGSRPAWLPRTLETYLGIVEWDAPRLCHHPAYPIGTNLSFRREAFAALGGFDPRLDRVGRMLLSCGDSEMCWRVERAGKRVSYTPAALAHHVIPRSRLTPSWFQARYYWQGRSVAVLDGLYLSRGEVWRRTVGHARALAPSLARRVVKGWGRTEWDLVRRCSLLLSAGYVNQVLAPRAVGYRG